MIAESRKTSTLLFQEVYLELTHCTFPCAITVRLLCNTAASEKGLKSVLKAEFYFFFYCLSVAWTVEVSRKVAIAVVVCISYGVHTE